MGGSLVGLPQSSLTLATLCLQLTALYPPTEVTSLERSGSRNEVVGSVVFFTKTSGGPKLREAILHNSFLKSVTCAKKKNLVGKGIQMHFLTTARMFGSCLDTYRSLDCRAIKIQGPKKERVFKKKNFQNHFLKL